MQCSQLAFYARSTVIKKHVRKSRYDPLIVEVALSQRHLAPKSDDYKELNSEQNDMHEQNIAEPNSTHPDSTHP